MIFELVFLDFYVDFETLDFYKNFFWYIKTSTVCILIFYKKRCEEQSIDKLWQELYDLKDIRYRKTP